MIEPTAAKVTISLRRDLLELADRLARERATTRSGVIAQLLEKEERAAVDALMAEGYREMAASSTAAAEDEFLAAADLISTRTRWDEPRGKAR